MLDNINIVAGSQYEIRLYANDGFTRLATSQPFVINPTNVSLRNVSLSAIQGETVNIAWNAIATPTASDWLGLYAIGADDGNYSGFAYTGGASSGEQAFALTSANLVAGQMYEMRLFANDGFTKLATSEPFRLLGSSAASITSNVFYIHNDHLGTPKALTDNNGQLVWYATAEPFGQATVNDDVDGDGVAVEFNIRQPGQYFDVESGFYYNYFRYYDPGTGRYVTSDPIGLVGGVNTYAYVGGNPLNATDPYGLAPTIKVPGTNATVRIDPPAPTHPNSQAHAHIKQKGLKEIVINKDGTGSHSTNPKNLKNKKILDFLRKRGFKLGIAPPFLEDVLKETLKQSCLGGNMGACKNFEQMGGEIVDPLRCTI